MWSYSGALEPSKIRGGLEVFSKFGGILAPKFINNEGGYLKIVYCLKSIDRQLYIYIYKHGGVLSRSFRWQRIG